MFTDYYGLSFNPFDKQNMKERDAYRSQDHRQMQERVYYLYREKKQPPLCVLMEKTICGWWR